MWYHNIYLAISMLTVLGWAGPKRVQVNSFLKLSWTQTKGSSAWFDWQARGWLNSVRIWFVAQFGLCQIIVKMMSFYPLSGKTILFCQWTLNSGCECEPQIQVLNWIIFHSNWSPTTFNIGLLNSSLARARGCLVSVQFVSTSSVGCSF